MIAARGPQMFTEFANRNVQADAPWRKLQISALSSTPPTDAGTCATSTPNAIPAPTQPTVFQFPIDELRAHFQEHFKKSALYSTPTPNADAGDNPDGAGDDANADGNGDEDPAFQFPIDELQAHFQEHMVRPGSNTVLKDWATYETTLPVRKESGRYLAQFSYWAADDDLKYILKQLETPVDDPRALLGYISAQSGAGKSACVLPIFLQSRRTNVNDKKFTHYIHLPFDNNYDNHFQSDDYQDELGRPKPGIRACKAHGAAFMHKVLQLFLRGENDANGNLEVPKYNQRIPINTDAPDTGVTQKLINKLINDVFLPGSRILFHVDEHRKANDNPHFRRGAFEALAKIPNCKCIATYIDIPYEIHRRGTSTVSRLPLPLPALDLNKMFTTHPELDFARHLNLTPPARSNQECQRQMATLKCRVAFLISQCFGEFHNGRLRETLVDKLREAVAKVEETNNTQGRLHGPSEVTEILREFAKALETIQEGYNLNISLDSRRHDNLLKLMTGYTEDDIDTLDNRLRPPLAVVANRIFASWKPLFQLQSFDFEPFNIAQSLFTAVAFKKTSIDDLSATPLERAYPFNIAKSLFTAVAFKKKSIDDLSATPLERAYLWSLLCYFQQDGKINFNDHTGEKSGDELHDDLVVNFKARDFKFGRLFLGPKSTVGCMINPAILEKDILYVVAEKDNAGKGDAGKGVAEKSVFTAVAFKKTSIDDLSATPLERAYLWSLLCYFQQDGKINFNDYTSEKSGDELHDDLIVNFKANNFKFGRLFLGPQSTDGCMINPTILEKDILYVVAEKDVAGKGDAGKGDAENSVADNGDPKHSDAGKGVAEKSVNKKTDAVAKLWQFRLIRLGDANNKKGAVVWRNTWKPAHRSNVDVSHPLCDLFFVDQQNRLVMIDIAGGKAGDKNARLCNFIKCNGEALKRCGIKDVL
eukprot:CAMPEP_0119570728 /NCGR_PEP_ID=MMETSP1352-20130426/43760_1 /TAXON_ID=265584 /ORGANISM="Stauroneis constricta, Strain CCMP1120" /LENGTH=930 /DNA_ID=CAMNT_0007620401 /DNA_START=183 /DNA_END=2971 /DNA_ORIENTATION=-